MSSREKYVLAYSNWLTALNNRDVDRVSDSVAEDVIYDGQNLNKEQCIRRIFDTLQASFVDNIELDMLTVDVDTRAVAARLIHHAVLKESYLGVPATGNVVEWPEYPLTWFNADLKIIRTQNLIDMDALRAGGTKIPRTPELKYAPAPPNVDIKITYQRYLDAINTQKTETLDQFCQPVVTHNLHVSSLDEYRFFITDSFKQVEGMKLELVELITDEVSQHIAARLELSGKPIGEWGGIAPTGKSVQFMEHAYYKLDDGKIKYVWALRDFDAYRKCLERQD